MNRALNPISSAGEFIVRTFKPRGETLAAGQAAMGSLRKAWAESDPLIARGSADLFALTGAAYFKGLDAEAGRRGSTVALRAMGGLAALQGTSRALRGGAPWRDETTGRVDAPGLPFI